MPAQQPDRPQPQDHPQQRDCIGPGVVMQATAFCYRVGPFQLGPIDLRLRAGQTHALLGPNGSGKTTLLRACQGLLPADSGVFHLFGEEIHGRPARLLNRVGYVPDDPEDLIPELTAAELWELAALARSQSDRQRREMLGLASRLAAALDFRPPRSPICGYSHGMRKKTQLVAALMHRPALVLLDEPRNGLDPLGILRLETLMGQLVRAGSAVLVASHDLHWAERISDEVHILDRGRLLASGRPRDLRLGADSSLVDTFLRLVAGPR